MNLFDNIWIGVNPDDFRWTYVDLCESVSSYYVFIYTWIAIISFEFTWNYMNLHEYVWNCVNLDELTSVWIYMDVLVKWVTNIISLRIYVNLYESASIWICMDLYEL
jgi:hypothetical protein